MAATYDATKLAENPVYQIRFMLGDTGDVEFLLQDEEIEFVLQSGEDLRRVAIKCCESICSRLAQRYDNKAGPLSDNLSQQYVHYRQRLSDLRKQLTLHSAAPCFTPPKHAIFSIDMMNAGPDDLGRD